MNHQEELEALTIATPITSFTSLIYFYNISLKELWLGLLNIL